MMRPEQEEAVYAVVDSPLGEITVCCIGDRVCGLWFEGQRRFGSTMPEGAIRIAPADNPAMAHCVAWLEEYFSGRFTPGCGLPQLRLMGSEFCMRVWHGLIALPPGITVSYAELAWRLGLPSAASRAVGTAVGKNPVSIIVPCHRVVRADGSPGGYVGGTERKLWLLRHEAR